MLNGTRIATVLLSLVVSAGSATAQEGDGGFAGGCGAMTICSGGHKVPGPGPGGVQNPHMDCAVCVVGDCHPGCDATLAPTIRLQYQEILKAANTGDTRAIIALANGAPGFVTFNSARKSLQVASCNKNAIIASLPLTSQLEVAMALRLKREVPPAVASVYQFAPLLR